LIHAFLYNYERPTPSLRPMQKHGLGSTLKKHRHYEFYRVIDHFLCLASSSMSRRPFSLFPSCATSVDSLWTLYSKFQFSFNRITILPVPCFPLSYNLLGQCSISLNLGHHSEVWRIFYNWARRGSVGRWHKNECQNCKQDSAARYSFFLFDYNLLYVLSCEIEERCMRCSSFWQF
jgi:hypothetical protein